MEGRFKMTARRITVLLATRTSDFTLIFHYHVYTLHILNMDKCADENGTVSDVTGTGA